MFKTSFLSLNLFDQGIQFRDSIDSGNLRDDKRFGQQNKLELWKTPHH